MTVYKSVRHHTNESFGLVNHILDSLAFSSEKTIASIVLLLSTIPEYVGMMGATGHRAVSITAACVSLVVIKLALREKPTKAAIPFTSAKVSIPVFWLLYVAQIGAGVAFIAHSGQYIDLGLIVISAVGAICSERIATIIQAEVKERSKVDLQAAKDAIKLNELQANADLRVKSKQAKFDERFNTSDITPNVQQDVVVGLTEEQRKKGQQNGHKAQQSAAQQRQAELYQMLQDEFNGSTVDSLNKSAIGRRLDVSPTTIGRDINALRKQGMLNGVVS